MLGHGSLEGKKVDAGHVCSGKLISLLGTGRLLTGVLICREIMMSSGLISLAGVQPREDLGHLMDVL